MKVSISIPTYHANGVGVDLTIRCINSCLAQTYPNFEVCVSDESGMWELKKYISDLKTAKVRYCHFKNENGDPGLNILNSINMATGDCYKFLAYDDFFASENSLKILVDHLEFNQWGICGHYQIAENNKNVRIFHPKWPDNSIDLALGLNTLGPPSVVISKTKINAFLGCVYSGDCELYLEYYQKLGKPYLINDPLICVYQHRNQFSDIMSKSEFNTIRANDIIYCLKKYFTNGRELSRQEILQLYKKSNESPPN